VRLPALDLAGVGEPVQPERVEYPWGSVGYSYGQEYFDYAERLENAVRSWWDAHGEKVTAEQNAVLWGLLFPDHQFYSVERVSLDEKTS
jgi:hypothetical protein